MTYYRQDNLLWSYQTYFNGFTFGKFGCLVTSLAMLIDKTPPETAKILRDNGCFDSQGLLNSTCASTAIGLEYNGKSTTRPNYICIAETSYYAPSTPQHFFVITPEGKIYDPLGKSIKYPIKSYRLFRGKGETMAGFDDNQMNSNFISLSTQLRTALLGHVDTAGVDNERAAGLASLKAGGVDSFAKIAMGIVNSQEFKDRWMLKTDCKPTECSPDLSEEFNQEVMKNTELQKELDLCNKKECICPEPKPCPAIDDLSASDLIIRGIRRWLGIK